MMILGALSLSKTAAYECYPYYMSSSSSMNLAFCLGGMAFSTLSGSYTLQEERGRSYDLSLFSPLDYRFWFARAHPATISLREYGFQS